MRQDTLISSIDGNPRYSVRKEGWANRWDYAPREDLLCSEKGEQFLNYWKAWEIKYSDDGFNYKEIGVVTDFNGDIPTATIHHGDFEKTMTGASLAEVCTKVIEVHEELLRKAEAKAEAKAKAEAEKEEAEYLAYCKEVEKAEAEAEVEAEVEEVEIPLSKIPFLNFTPKQHKLFEKEWVADYIDVTGCKKAVAKNQYEVWVNQEGWQSRDSWI